MKKLQNNFTTPEQSKRLLELGVPADSADCFYSYYKKTYAHSEYVDILWHRPRFITEDNIPSWNAKLLDGTQTYLPCWSVGRLLEIINHCVSNAGGFRTLLYMHMTPHNISDWMGAIMIVYEELAKGNCIDFSKLEK
jgi:hypothetical protein